MAEQPKEPENWAQARASIDRGARGDKIANPDPAAAPLGTDAEAGGVTTAGQDIARSAGQETPGATAQAPRAARRQRMVPWLVASLALALAAIVALLIAA